MINLRLPNITGGMPEEQIAQMQSYMYQLVEQLNFALSTVDNGLQGNASNIVTEGKNGVNESNEKAETTFNSIKTLIIKSADIVNAYYDEMKKNFDGVYVAESDYGAFVQRTNASIEANSSNIATYYRNMQSIISNIADISDQIAQTNAWIKSGLLGADAEGIDIYGIEVGQITEVNGEEVFNKYARFTSAGIFFYMPGATDPIAWMTGTKLYITNAEITGTLTLGKYIVDTANGLAFKWIGGE